ncbi:hypothetical protein [Streptococcus catagoni]|uniref:hypothetical protein n=1 Tax=Streptococcus catagoni TaxID=2654874 RepID=UPI0014095A94|nr:hypothetical protein [Streptococcus catagoni]
MEKEQAKQIYFAIKQEAELHGYKEIENRMDSAFRTSVGSGFDYYTFGLETVIPLLTSDSKILKLRDDVVQNRLTFRSLFKEHTLKIQEINLNQKITTRAKREMSIEVRESFVNQFSKLESKFNSQKKELAYTANILLNSLIRALEECYSKAPELLIRLRMYLSNNHETYNTNKFADDIYVVRPEPKSYAELNEFVDSTFANVARIHNQDPKLFINQLLQDAEKSDLLEEEYIVQAYLDCKEEYEQYLIEQFAKEEERRAVPTPEPKSSIVSKALNKLMGGNK